MTGKLTRRGFIGGGAALLSTFAARSYAAAVGAGKPNLKFGVLSDIHVSPVAYMLKYLKGDPKQHRPRETDLFEKALEYFGYGDPLFARIPVCAHARAIEKSRKQVLLRLAVANGTV